MKTALIVVSLFVAMAVSAFGQSFYGHRTQKVNRFTAGQKAAGFASDYFDLNNSIYVGSSYGLGGTYGGGLYGSAGYGAGTGLSYNSLVGGYASPAIDVSRLLHAAEAHLKRAQDNSQQGLRLLLEIARTAQEERNRASREAAELKLAEQRLDLLKKFMEALKGIGVSPSDKLKKKVTPPVRLPAGAAAAVQTFTTATCVRCHGGVAPASGLNLTDLSKVDKSYEVKILFRIQSTDDDVRMPPPPAPRLTVSEVALFKAARGK